MGTVLISVARRNANRQRAIAADERRVHALGFAEHFDPRETLHDSLPDVLQLQLGTSIAHAAMNAVAERDVLARPFTIDDVALGLRDHLGVAIARDVPHHDLVAFANLL